MDAAIFFGNIFLTRLAAYYEKVNKNYSYIFTDYRVDF